MRSSKLLALLAVAAFATACGGGNNADNQMNADTTTMPAAAPAPADTGMMPASTDTMGMDTTMTTTSSMD